MSAIAPTVADAVAPSRAGRSGGGKPAYGKPHGFKPGGGKPKDFKPRDDSQHGKAGAACNKPPYKKKSHAAGA